MRTKKQDDGKRHGQPENSWKKRYVLDALKRGEDALLALNTRCAELERKLTLQGNDIVRLNVKIGIWGTVSALVMALAYMLLRGIKL